MLAYCDGNFLSMTTRDYDGKTYYNVNIMSKNGDVDTLSGNALVAGTCKMLEPMAPVHCDLDIKFTKKGTFVNLNDVAILKK